MNKKIVFRVDLAEHIGTGHFQRCKALADELRRRGHTCIFFIRDYQDGYLNLFKTTYDLLSIGSSKLKNIPSTEKDWLIVTEEKDASDFLSTLKSNSLIPDAIVVDHYSISSKWEKIVSSATGSSIVVIDDLANRKHFCDLLVDQNYYLNFKHRYTGLTPQHTVQLLGPKFAILNPTFKELRKVRKKRSGILVNFGGSAKKDIWQKVTPALQIMSKKLKFKVVTGLFSDSCEFLKVQKSLQSYNIECHETIENMPEVMNSSLFSIGASGTTVWERFSLGLNSALIDIAANQTELVHALSKRNLIDYLGNSASLNTEKLIQYLDTLSLEKPLYKDRQKKIFQAVDGLGTERITQHIELVTR